ncbi:MAG: J domain-containing protein [Ilumatobacter sp.]|uniref:DnaJ C-terminal domain-containing protein n=1 Tax=Ilumatobacter sp. TaxID=1967498 RepID=UPI003C742ED0
MAVQSDWSNTNYYDVLGVAENASDKDIRSAYRKLARKLHPDTNADPEAERRFKEVTAAHEILGDADRRKEYDEFRRLGPAGAQRDGGFGANGFGPGGTRVRVNNVDGDLGDLGDLFGDLFGGGSGFGPYGPSRSHSSRSTRSRAQRGADLSSTLSLPFLDAVHGTTTAINLVSNATCDTCSGSGAAPGSAPSPCSRCSGSGEQIINTGGFAFREPCEQCHGRGVTIDAPCSTCSGTGRVKKPRTVKVRIPAGVEDGQTIRLPKRGGPGSDGGPAGDLLLTVDVEPHPDFGRLGNNLTITVPIAYPELVLGTDVTVPTIDAGTVTVRVPPGTPSGRTLRVNRRGIPGTGGDLLVTLDVIVPTNPSAQERDLIEQLAAASSERPRARREAMT